MGVWLKTLMSLRNKPNYAGGLRLAHIKTATSTSKAHDLTDLLISWLPGEPHSAFKLYLTNYVNTTCSLEVLVGIFYYIWTTPG